MKYTNILLILLIITILTGLAFATPTLTSTWDYNTYNNGGNEVARSGIQIGNYLYVCGYINDTASLDWRYLKMDINKTIIWEKTYNGGGIDICDWITLGTDGNLYLGGYINNNGNRRLLKIEPKDGNTIWANNYGTGRFNQEVWLDGNLYATGMIGTNTGGIQKINQSGTSIWSKTNSSTYMMNSITTDGTYLYIAGGTASGASSRWLIEKYDTSGNQIWTKNFGSNQSASYGIAYYDNYLYAVGYWIPGAIDLPLQRKIDLSGNEVWVGDYLNKQGGWTDIKIIDSNYLLLVGGFYNMISASSDKDWALLLLNFDGNSVADWNYTSSGTNEDVIMSTTYNGDGNLYLFGYGTDLVSSSSDRDWWFKRTDLNTGGTTPLPPSTTTTTTTSITTFQVPNTLDQNITLTCNDLGDGCKQTTYKIDLNDWIILNLSGGTSTTDETEDNGLTFSTTNEFDWHGFVIQPNKDVNLIGVKRASVNTATFCKVFDYTSRATLATAASSGLDNNFTTPLTLLQDVNYIIGCGIPGHTIQNTGIKNGGFTYPITTTNITWIEGMYGMSDAGAGGVARNDSNYIQAFCIQSLYTKTITTTTSDETSFITTGLGTHTIQYYSTDSSDNNESINTSYFTTNATTNPTTTLTKTSILDNNNQTTITLNCLDYNGDSCATTKYMFDSNGTWFTYTTPFTYTANGHHTIDYNSTDNQGNVETTKRSDINMPVLLTIKYPKNITTLIQLTEKWALRSIGGVIVNITDLTTDQNLYVAPNILTTFYISDVNGNYTQSTFTKTYYNDSSNGTTDILQAYLYNINSSLATTINVLNKNTLAAIPNITIKFYGNLPGLGNIFIGQGTTDSKGQILQLFTAGQSYVFNVYNGSTFLQSYNYTAVTTQAYIYFNYLNIDTNSYPTITPIPNSDLNSVLTQFYVFRNTLFTSCTNEDPCFPSALIAIVLTIIALIAATSVSVTGGAFVGIKGLSIIAFCCFTIFLGIGFLPMFIYAFLGTITLLMAVVVQ